MSATVASPPKKNIVTIPRSLVYEEFSGHVFPYKGYQEVLKKEKKAEEIMGSSSIQSLLVTLLVFFVKSKLPKKKYLVATNESGLHLGKNNNFSNDIAVFEKSKVTPSNKYFVVAPVLAIEVDIRADLTDEDALSETDYIFEKSKKMISFGTQLVIWVLTSSRKIIIVDESSEWRIVDFDVNIPLIEGIVMNLQQLITEEDIEI